MQMPRCVGGRCVRVNVLVSRGLALRCCLWASHSLQINIGCLLPRYQSASRAGSSYPGGHDATTSRASNAGPDKVELDPRSTGIYENNGWMAT